MTRIAVIAHRGKTLGGGLPELRRVLERRGATDVFWREVGKSRFAASEVKKALADAAELIFVWGGDGMVQRCVDVVAGTDATLAIALPLAVALSRMYRGMHHPLDVTAGFLMGLAAISIALFATRTAGEAARLRSSAAGDRGRA